MASIKFQNDEDDYEPSSSDDEYDENERKLLNKYRNSKKQDSESETEVFGVGTAEDSDEDDAQSDIALSDVEGQDIKDELPDRKAWGKQKKMYYGADYVDPDYGGYQEKDIQAAEMEEEEVRDLQNELTEQLDDNNFSFDTLFKKKEKEELKEPSTTDVSEMSKKEKLEFLQKQSPALFGLMDDFKGKLTLCKNYLGPLLDKVEKGEVKKCQAVEFVEHFYKLILNYATNIYMYMLLTSERKLKNHPIIKKLYQYRQLLAKMEPVFEEIIKPQIELLQSADNKEQTGEVKEESTIKSKKLPKLLSLLKNKQKASFGNEQVRKKIKLDKGVSFNLPEEKNIQAEEAKESTEQNQDGKLTQDEEEAGVGKRAITYQIAKNKGLTPNRKKELRNPRVKHKLKFKKALVRRKGAVREPRKELTRYSGEISGIKASVSKSIKIKT